MQITLFLTMSLLLAAVVCPADAASLNLVPWPKKMTMGKGDLTLPARLPIKVAGSDKKAAKKVAETFAVDLKEIGFTPTLVEGSKAVGITLSITDEPSLGKEDYRLWVDKEIRISAPTERGLFWGTRTALQLLSAGPDVPVPTLSIQDKPEFGYRGFMVDVARNFHAIEFHKRMVKNLARYKINVYHIHFSDDQSYTLPSDAFPNLPTPGRHYTKEQLKDLVKLAERYNITIVPEIDVPGHASSLCAAVPDFVCQGKPPRWMICAGSERSYAAIEALISETMDIFPGPYFHIGADEVDLSSWDGCPDCEALVAKEGLKDKEALYNHFINRLNCFVKSKGRKTIAWEGFKPGVKPEVDKDVMVEEFANYPATPPDSLMNAGYNLINASWSPLYICQDDASTPEVIAEWNALYFNGKRPPVPLDKMLKIKPDKRLKGVSMCSWENTEESEEAAIFGTAAAVKGYSTRAPRLQIFSERAWTGDKTSSEDLLARIGVK